MRTLKPTIAFLAGWLMLISGTVFARVGEGTPESTSAAAVERIPAEPGEAIKNSFVKRSDSKKSCTIIYASDSAKALAGNNEDWINPFPLVRFQPAKDGKFGYMCVGFQGGWPKKEGFQQEGAVNEKGLFYDFATAEVVEVPRDPNKPDYWALMNKVMEECATVEDALKLFTDYNFREVWGGHYLIGDRFGNSAIIEPLTFIRKSGRYQVITNFLQSKADPETATDARYRVASELFENADTISVDLLRRILNETHMEDYGGSWTLYSNIYNLKTGDVYFYNFHNYDNVAKLNIHEELKKGEHVYLLSSLFPYEPFATRQYKATWVTKKLYEKIEQNGVAGEDGAIAFYKDVNSPDNEMLDFSLGERHLTAIGYALLGSNEVTDAVELFSFMVEEFPQSANAWDCLGEAHMKAGKKDLAKYDYEKSLELDSDNENAKKMLEQMQK